MKKVRTKKLLRSARLRLGKLGGSPRTRSLIFSITSLVLFVVALVLLLTPISTRPPVDVKANAVARHDYRATHTFTYEAKDPAAYARIREAMSKVLRVYRQNDAIRERQVAALNETFASLRRVCLARRSAREELEKRSEVERQRLQKVLDSATDDAQRSEARRLLDELRTREADQLARTLAPHDQTLSAERVHALQRLGPDVSPSSLDELMRYCFPEPLQKKGANLLAWVLEDRIIEEKTELLTEIERGVNVIRPGEDGYEHADLEDFVTRHDAQGQVALSAHELFAVRHDPPYFDDTRIRDAFVDILTGLVIPTTRYAPAATRAARDAARSAVHTRYQVTVQADQLIVQRNQVITPDQVAMLEAMNRSAAEAEPIRNIAGIVVIVLLFLGMVWFFGARQLRGTTLHVRDTVLMCVVLVIQLGIIRFSVGVTNAITTAWNVIPVAAYYFAMPLAMGAMFVRLFLRPAAAVIYTVAFSLLYGVLIDGSGIPQFEGNATVVLATVALLANLVGAARMAIIRRRADVLKGGLIIGLFSSLLVIGFLLLDGPPLGWESVAIVAGAALGGLGSAAAVAVFTPVFEWAFGYTTDVKLLELGSLNHPILKRLMLEAPGTYHHSFLVGNLVESAAESIGANPLLARVAALYHDLGKLKNPVYFGENQRRGDNRHDKLLPTMSALIIRAHVKDSVRMAEENGLGLEIRDIIQQHHGTTLIRFFYDKALEATDGSGPPPSDSDYRYPGPKPQTREAALVLLADSAEAAVRSLPDKSPSRIQGMVHRVVLEKFVDGQLDECDLTLRDLHRIELIFTTVLQGVHHARPEYPERARQATTPKLVAVTADGVPRT